MYVCMYACMYVCMYVYVVKSHEMDPLLKFIFSNPNGLLICYSMYPQK